jgi:hypothetical protein
VPRTRPPYPEEFRREAIKLALLGDKPQRREILAKAAVFFAKESDGR